MELGGAQTCVICGGSRCQSFYRAKDVPVFQNVLFPDRAAAINSAVGDLDLNLCQDCNMIWNAAFDPAKVDYSTDYENTQSHSPYFAAYMTRLAEHLVKDLGISGKQVVEIGCGKGSFLDLICSAGGNKGVGFDPSFRPELHKANPDIQVIQDYYSAKYSDIKGDLYCCRHVLEHINNPLGFLRNLREAMDEHQALMYFEVPSVHWILKNGAFWDLFYEHCNYFSRDAVYRLFGDSGFEVMSIREEFDGQYFWILARPVCPGNTLKLKTRLELSLVDHVQRFLADIESKFVSVNEMLKGSNYGETVIWGAAAKGVTLLNSLKLNDQQMPFVVDINPLKQGFYVPRTAQKVVSPSFLKELKPKRIIVMNPIYLEEVKSTLRELSVEAEVAAI